MRNKAHGCGSFAVPVGFVLRFYVAVCMQRSSLQVARIARLG